MNNINLYNLFSCPVLKTKLAFDNNKLKNYVLSLNKKDKGRKISNEGGWQSNNLIISEDNKSIFKPLLSDIIKYSQKYIENFELKKDKKYGISNMWANINKYKDNNSVHTHPFSLISGVYYIQSPENSGDIEFLHPDDSIGCYFIGNYYEKLNQNNSATWSITPENNDLILFPSFLKHKVNKNLNKKFNRISIAFNIADYKIKWIQ